MVRCLVVGAGASVAEGLEFGLPFEQCPPLVSDFAAKLWREFNPHPILDRFLASCGYEVQNRDGRPLFRQLERNPLTRERVNIEKFFEFAWRHRNKSWKPDMAPDGSLPADYIYGFVIANEAPNAVTVNSNISSSWHNLMLHGVGSPLQHILVTQFYENGSRLRQLRVGQSVGKALQPGDVVLSLNYDTLFELALHQIGVLFSYAPNIIAPGEISVCKPHGSLNLVVDDRKSYFCFGRPEWLGVPAPQGTVSFSGLLPPRYHKRYEQLPISKKIMRPILDLCPHAVTFWGVGFTSSDVDLLEIYRRWTRSCERVEVINPDGAVAVAAEELLYKKVYCYADVRSWLCGIDT